MLNYNLGSVTLQQIQIFLSVAETCNYTLSANNLHLSQPAISKSIISLEKALGFSLFKRTSRSVSLTEEGQLLYKKWKTIPETVQNSYIDASLIKTMSLKSLNIGLTDTIDSKKFFWNKTVLFRQSHPDISVNVEAEDMKSLENSLSDGKYDLIFIPDFEHYSVEKTKFSYKYAAKSNVQIIVPKGSPLINKSVLTFSDICDKSITALDPEINPNFLRAVKEIYQDHNMEPIIGHSYKSNFQLRYSQVTENSIHITDDFWEYSPDEYSKKIPLKDYYNGIICVWNNNTEKTWLNDFINLFNVKN